MIKIAKFNGMVPKTDSTLLTDEYAGLARNVNLESGKLAPMHDDAPCDATLVPETKTIYKHLDDWLGWNKLMDVTPGTVNDDFYSRIFMTDGESRPRFRGLLNGEIIERDVYIAKPEKVTTSLKSLFQIEGTAFTFRQHWGGAKAQAAPVSFTAAKPSSGTSGAATGESSAIIWGGGEVTSTETSVDGDEWKFRVQTWGTKSSASGGVYYTPLGGGATLTFGSYTVELPANDGNGYATVYNSKSKEYGTLRVSFSDVGTSSNDSNFKYECAENEVVTTQAAYIIEISMRLDHVDAHKYVSYSQTFVDDLGQEGPPSDVSEIISYYPGDTVTLNFSGTGDHVVTRRLYRTAGNSRASDFYYLDELTGDMTTGTYTDDSPDSELAEKMIRCENPIEGLHSLNTISGCLVAAKGKEVCFSEQHQPNNWPSDYFYTVRNNITGLAVSGNSVYVLTDAEPEVLSGSHPELMNQQTLTLKQACVSKRSICTSGNTVYYASPDGLIGIDGESGARIVTRELFSREQWQELNPSSMQCAVHDNKIHIFTDSGLWIYEPAENQLTCAETTVQCFYENAVEDILYVVKSDKLYQFTCSPEPLTYTWRSRLYEFNYAGTFSWMRINTRESGLPVSLRLYANDVLVFQRDGIITNLALRLPYLRREKRWRVEVVSSSPLFDVAIATTLAEVIG